MVFGGFTYHTILLYPGQISLPSFLQKEWCSMVSTPTLIEVTIGHDRYLELTTSSSVLLSLSFRLLLVLHLSISATQCSTLDLDRPEACINITVGDV